MEQPKYGFNVILSVPMDTAIERTTAALGEEGFGILSEIDVAAAFKKKLDLDHRPYRILGACNPHLARHAIEADPNIGLLLPCNVLVQDNQDGTCTVGFMDPVAVMALVDKPGVEALASDVRERLERVRQALEAG
ncbi:MULTISPECIES: DUF302 domain-containing protein [unclassified Thioalkalivibrio]|jgi:uncharacterized protein (DUF302 family)|nr:MULTISPECIES: DUF302 domain-containing protein [unclassified Thioalkalivibrio]ADC72383.1 protein of unknown function DUF302 [Thioalkalivibrio sp. K90mix]